MKLLIVLAATTIVSAGVAVVSPSAQADKPGLEDTHPEGDLSVIPARPTSFPLTFYYGPDNLGVQVTVVVDNCQSIPEAYGRKAEAMGRFPADTVCTLYRGNEECSPYVQYVQVRGDPTRGVNFGGITYNWWKCTN
ncbi:hypothetical protein B0H16DRAFT_331729 [Mycena metata]|uniref:Uncharacterized protein n=1 Tax=Mycena metata TaxID=1033252 RepID=A0AAD7MM18_9AGAR|nr:hypothetical protein B0H16DRAFT_331729 [Mycena metata]